MGNAQPARDAFVAICNHYHENHQRSDHSSSSTSEWRGDNCSSAELRLAFHKLSEVIFVPVDVIQSAFEVSQRWKRKLGIPLGLYGDEVPPMPVLDGSESAFDTDASCSARLYDQRCVECRFVSISEDVLDGGSGVATTTMGGGAVETRRFVVDMVNDRVSGTVRRISGAVSAPRPGDHVFYLSMQQHHAKMEHHVIILHPLELTPPLPGGDHHEEDDYPFSTDYAVMHLTHTRWKDILVMFGSLRALLRRAAARLHASIGTPETQLPPVFVIDYDDPAVGEGRTVLPTLDDRVARAYCCFGLSGCFVGSLNCEDLCHTICTNSSFSLQRARFLLRGRQGLTSEELLRLAVVSPLTEAGEDVACTMIVATNTAAVPPAQTNNDSGDRHVADFGQHVTRFCAAAVRQRRRLLAKCYEYGEYL